MTATVAPPAATRDQPRSGRRWPPRLLRETRFRRFWWAQAVSLFGDQVSALALPLVAVVALHAGPAEMGYLTAAALLPNLLLSLVAGAWVDRYPHKRRLMIAADLGRGLLVTAVPAAYVLDLLSMGQLYVVALLTGTLTMLFAVSQSTLFVALVPRTDYVAASSLLNGTRAASYVAGPGAAGVLVQTLTAPVALLADAVSYLASAVLLSRIKPAEPPASAEPGLRIHQGLRYLARSRMLRWTLLGTTTLNLFNYMFAALFVLYAVTELGVSPGQLGAVLGAGAAGALVGAAVTGRLVRRLGLGPALVLGLVGFPAPLLLVPLAGGPTPVVLGLLLAAELLSTAGVMVLDIADGSVQAAVIPDALRARVAGAYRTVNYGIRPLGAVLGGALGATLGVRPALWIATAGATAGVLWVLPSPVARLRDLPPQDEPG